MKVENVTREGEGWSEYETDYLIKALNNGDSMRMVAEHLGRARNAVAGKKHRLKASGVIFINPDADETSRVNNRAMARAKAQLKRKEEKMKPKLQKDDNLIHLRKRNPKTGQLTPVHLRTLPLSPNPKTLLDLGYRECRAPVGPDPRMGHGALKLRLFCAEPTEEGCQYCAEHSKRFLNPRYQATGKGMILSRVGTTMGGA